MQWRNASETAARIAGHWTTEGGPGGAILLFDQTDIRAEACGGLASLEHGRPFTAETVVRLGGIGKHICAALLVRLAAEGRLSLEDALGRHLPQLPPAPGAVPIARALDMTGGLPDAMETLWLLGVPWTASFTRDAMLRFAYSIDTLNFPPGTELAYSSTGYRLVEAVLATRGIRYADAVHARFFRPLGLSSFCLPEDATEPVPALAPGYVRATAGWRRGRYGLPFSAARGLAGSASDLVAWLQALVTGRAPLDGLLAPLGARRRLADGRITAYGLGLARAALGDEIAIGHSGWLPGYQTDFLLLPERGAGVVVLSNREDTDAQGIALSVLAALVGAPPPQSAAGVLPQGLFAAEQGSFWIEHAAGRLTILGATEPLVLAADGAAISRSGQLPITLRFADGTMSGGAAAGGAAAGGGIAGGGIAGGGPADGAIEGEIGYVARRFRPVPGDAEIAADFVGTWVCAEQNARFEITPGGFLAIGAGPLHTTLPLTPLDDRRALTDRADGSWRQRACLELETPDTLRVATYRSRVLRFTRA